MGCLDRRGEVGERAVRHRGGSGVLVQRSLANRGRRLAPPRPGAMDAARTGDAAAGGSRIIEMLSRRGLVGLPRQYQPPVEGPINCGPSFAGRLIEYFQ